MGLQDIMDWLGWQNKQTATMRERMKARQDAINSMGRASKDALDSKNQESIRKKQAALLTKPPENLPFKVPAGLEHMFTYQGGDLGIPLHQQVAQNRPRLTQVYNEPYAPMWMDYLEEGVPEDFAIALKNRGKKEGLY